MWRLSNLKSYKTNKSVINIQNNIILFAMKQMPFFTINSFILVSWSKEQSQVCFSGLSVNFA